VVSFAASNVADGRFDTAWRVPGDGSGQSLTFHWSTPVTIKEVCVAVGYDKVDPVTGEDRFLQNRRPTLLRVTPDPENPAHENGASIDTDPAKRTLQCEDGYVGAPVTSFSVTILSSSAASREFTAISEVVIKGSSG